MKNVSFENLVLLGTSNDNLTTGFSFSPSELFVNLETGECYEETYNSRQNWERECNECEEFGTEPPLNALECAGNIEQYFEYGYCNIPAQELKERYYDKLREKGYIL